VRNDKKPSQIIKETEVPLNKIKKTKPRKSKVELPIKITHPDKVIYPDAKITKIELADYYDEIHEWILPYISNRPLTLVRCPENYKQCFYQKHLTKGMPKSLFGVNIKEKDKTDKYIYLKDRDALITLVQMNVFEIHPWGSRVEKLDYPDVIIFDLDPAENLQWVKVVLAAKRIQKILSDYKLKSFVKTTGGKGLHVVVPILPEYTWEEVKNFSHAVVQYLELSYPSEYTSIMSKVKRKGKIFIDYLRNQRGATAIAVYSSRARPGAPVSVPIDWDELTKNIKDTQFNIFTLPQRLNKLKDPWKDFFKIKQSLKLDKLK